MDDLLAYRWKGSRCMAAMDVRRSARCPAGCFGVVTVAATPGVTIDAMKVDALLEALVLAKQHVSGAL
ncbi:hypothetical protein ACSFA8_10865 [Variovorax sp. RT4R15]|uniref:hypothetical protein n=1 Tax=Variovorax sp. RT4R15 TaxID=3443737 RepID=UPI003F47896B